MACRITIRVTGPDGERYDAPVDEVIEDSEEETSGTIEEWREVDRQTEALELDGIEVDRIITVTFEKPSGKRVRLIFEEAL